jgi:Mg2+ and Co2+ transporter CorA
MSNTDKTFEELSAEDCKDLDIVFTPGAFDNFEGTQEELDAFIAEITRVIKSGEILEKSQPLDLDNMPEEELIALARAFGIDPETGEDTNIGKTLQ